MNRWSAQATGEIRLSRFKNAKYRRWYTAGDIGWGRGLTEREAHGSAVVSKPHIYDGHVPDEHVVGNTKTYLTDDGMYLALCWCERTYVSIPQKMIGKGTLSCGLDGCREGGVVKCQHCSQPLPKVDGRVQGAGRGKWCSNNCAQKAAKAERIRRRRELWQNPLTEVEQYDLQIAALAAEIEQLKGEGNMTTTTRSLWEQTIDFGTHNCRVERLEDRSGLLTITLVGIAILHQQPVAINNGGLESSDVTDWRELCEAILRDPDRWNGAFARSVRL